MEKFYTNIHQWGANLLVREWDNGVRKQFKVPYKPYLFVPSKKADSPYKTLQGNIIDKVEFGSISEAKEFTKQYENVDNFEIFGLTSFPYVFLHDEYPGEIKFDPSQINIVSLDIETNSENGFPDIPTANRDITAITLSKKGKKAVLGMGDYIPKTSDIIYFKCSDEADLLTKFLQAVKTFDIDVWTGWNAEFFDLPYLYNRITRILGEKAACKMSPWGIVQKKTVEVYDNRFQETVEIIGTSILDYMNLYKKFAVSMQADSYKESLKLDEVAFHELGEKKLDYSEHGTKGTAAGLNYLYKNNYQLFMEYNVQDVVLVDKMEDKLKFIEQIFTLAYDAKVNYNDAFTTVKMWDVIIHNYLLDKNIVIPIQKVKHKDHNIVGAYVKEPIVGLYNWVVSFDLNSLYPHLIMQYQISPECLVKEIEKYICPESVDMFLNGDLETFGIRDDLVKNNQTIVPTGCVFSKDKRGFLPELMEKLYNDRSVYKKRMLDAQQKYENEKDPAVKKEIDKEIAQNKNLQISRKIQLNACYGALANRYFRWFDPRLAESITKSGQLSIRWIERKLNEFLNKNLNTINKDYIIGADTDSVYICLDELVKKNCPDKSKEEIVEFLDKASSKIIEPFISKCYEELAVYTNAYSQKMVMKREVIADKGIWTGKKHYLLNVYNSEGVKYKEPKAKIVGLEAVKSSTPSLCRQGIKDALKIILNQDEDTLIKFIDEFRTKFFQASFKEIASPRGCNNLTEYQDKDLIFSKGTPFHVRGALVYNNLLRKKGLDTSCEVIGNSDKIRYIYLKLPNPCRSNVISCPDDLPKELGLDKYIDYEIQFEKTFMVPLNIVLKVINWSVSKESNLESLFE